MDRRPPRGRVIFAMAKQWYVRAGRKIRGPFSAAKLKELVSRGSLTPRDFVRPEDRSEWTAAAEVKGLFDALPTPASSPPTRATGTSRTAPASNRIPVPRRDEAPDEADMFGSRASSSKSHRGMRGEPARPRVDKTLSDDPPALWNPKWILLNGMLLGWGFGAYLLARNWAALGRPERSLRCWGWLALYVLLLVVFVAIPLDSQFHQGFSTGLMGFLFVIWGLVECWPHRKFVEENLQSIYSPRRWFAPVASILAVYSLFIGAAVAVNIEQDEYISIVRNGHTHIAPDIPVGAAIDRFMLNERWSSYHENGDHFVLVEGKIKKFNRPVDARLLFQVYPKTKTFDCVGAEVDGSNLNKIEQALLLTKILDEYKNR